MREFVSVLSKFRVRSEGGNRADIKVEPWNC